MQGIVLVQICGIILNLSATIFPRFILEILLAIEFERLEAYHNIYIINY